MDGASGLPPEELLELGVNVSGVHPDLMVGGAAVDVDGIDAAGAVTPVVRGGSWRLLA